MAPYDKLQFNVLMLGYVVLVAGLVYVSWRRRAEWPETGKWIAAAALLAVALRVGLATPGIFYENSHGYRYVGMAIEPASDLHVYGSGWQAFFHLFLAWLPPRSAIVIAGNIGLGALTVLAGGLLGARLWGPKSGVTTALALALAPVHLQMSATESPFILTMALTVLAAWAVVEMRAQQSWELAIIAAIAAAAASQIRPVMSVVVIPVILALGVACRGEYKQLLKTPATYVLLALMGLLCIGHAQRMYALHLERGASHYFQFVEASGASAWEIVTQRSPLSDPSVTPPAYLILALLGVAAGFRRVGERQPWAPTLVLALALLAVTWLYAGRIGFFSELMRFAIPGQVFLALLAGAGLGAIYELAEAHAPGRVHAARGLCAVALLSTLASRAPWTQQTVDQLEYRFLQDAYAELPEGCVLVTPQRRMNNNQVEAHFPVHEFRDRVPGPDRREGGLLSADMLGPDYVLGDRCHLYYRGLACGLFVPDEPRDSALRPECADFEARWTLTPVFERAIVEGRSLPSHRFEPPADELRLGFYRLEP